MTRVAIVNQHTNNFGDDIAGVALLKEVADLLKPSGVDVFYVWQGDNRGLPIDDDSVRHHCFDLLSGRTDSRVALARHALVFALTKRTSHPHLRALVTACRDADAVFVAPAGSNLGIYRDWMYLLVLVILVCAGVRPTFCQNTIASSDSWVFDRLAGFVLRRSTVFVREAASKEWLSSQGIGAALGVDTAFLLEPPPPPTRRHNVLAVVPTALSSWHRDFRSLDDSHLLLQHLPRDLSRIATEFGLDVIVVPHLYGVADERVTLEEVCRELAAAGCAATIADVSSYEDYIASLSEAAVVVSMRYHGLVVAALCGTPCVPICYENKMVDASRYLAIEPLALSADSIKEGDIYNRITDALHDSPAISSKLRARSQVLRHVAKGPVVESLSGLMRRHQPQVGDGAPNQERPHEQDS